MKFDVGDGAYVNVDEDAVLWWRDCVGDEVVIATTQEDLDEVIAILREAGKELPRREEAKP